MGIGMTTSMKKFLGDGVPLLRSQGSQTHIALAESGWSTASGERSYLNSISLQEYSIRRSSLRVCAYI